MNRELWSEVDEYLADALIEPDPVLEQAIDDSDKAGLPSIAVAPNQGKLLNLLARMAGAATILELGTLGGYSTIWLARALPADGRLITLEFDPKHAEVARANIARADLADRVEVRVGRALDTLPQIAAERHGPFDLVFIDADKPNLAPYLTAVLELSRPGTTIVVDNVVRQGMVADPDNTEPPVQGARRMFELLANEHRLDATAVQTVGSKGYDGFVLAIVR